MSFKSGAVLLLLVACASTVRGDEKGNAALNGTWLLQEATLAGKAFPEEIRKSTKLVVKDDSYSVTAGAALDQGTVKVNAAVKPKQMDIIGVSGPNKGKTILAIYEQDGDSLRVCYDLGGKERPTEFKSEEGSLQFLAKYSRGKP